MKLSIIGPFLLVLPFIMFLQSCSINPTEQPDMAPSEMTPLEFTQTTEPTAQSTTITTPSSTNLPHPGLIISNSPDNRFTIELDLAETPVMLTIVNNVSNQETQIPISDRYYNKIMEDGPEGFRWSSDNKILMFVLYRDSFPESPTEDSACFFAIDVEQANLLMVYYSSIPGHIWHPDETGVIVIEHGGLNDIFDYYYPETNCYRLTLNGECVNSNAPSEGTP